MGKLIDVNGLKSVVGKINEDINNEVLKLSVLLKKCFNVDTGKLDINKFLCI